MPNGNLQSLDGQRIFSANIDVSLGRANRVGRDQHAFQHAMGIAFQHAAVHERAGIAFVRVADHKFLRSDGLRDRAPFQSGRISCPATPAQSALHHLLDYFDRSHLGESLNQRAISRGGDVLLDSFGINDAGVLQNNLLLPLEKRNIRRAEQSCDRSLLQSVE